MEKNMNTRKIVMLMLFTLTIISTASAEILQMQMRVEGMTWNFWAYGVEQHLGRQSGVQKVHVSLIDGKVEITPKNDGLIDPVQILKATYDSGVSVAEMTMVAKGQIVKSESGIALQVSSSRSFAIVQNDLSRQLEAMAGSASQVTVKGSLFQKQKDQKKKDIPASLTLTILEIQQKEWSRFYFC